MAIGLKTSFSGVPICEGDAGAVDFGVPDALESSLYGRGFLNISASSTDKLLSRRKPFISSTWDVIFEAGCSV
eukprot:CAMPEP_0172531478 /NCGR_PEP_ID=MMETSP1067-20121228/4874_1 /TAXON_ID=265564 ORGANISM="Thalassiosira punctigera, Strain Tpunct2005C2" /NCGR_SAMPLE_ID=MMETSP1067 /ASSEMBLY_ACC=CAM_ASM_000444 /LENGTH=72 /DNA_ID=CAMNT_0013315863 /DNA_START=253 /DNA_END=471 /DNA_ORIENTATION=+